MQTRILLTREPIAQCLRDLGAPWSFHAGAEDRLDGKAGACLDFYGVVRDREDPAGAEAGYPITAIEYEAHEEMAVHQLRKILSRLSEAYPLEAALVIHRVGLVKAGEASLYLRLITPHREEALQACAEFVHELKRWVPIWKHPVRA